MANHESNSFLGHIVIIAVIIFGQLEGNKLISAQENILQFAERMTIRCLITSALHGVSVNRKYFVFSQEIFVFHLTLKLMLVLVEVQRGASER